VSENIAMEEGAKLFLFEKIENAVLLKF